MPVTIENQVVLVVGASSGIGRETAALFARGGARVMACTRREERLRELKESLAREGQTVETLAADAAYASQMEGLAQRTRERLGEIDILVFATGTNVPDRSMKRLTTEIWDMMLSVNFERRLLRYEGGASGDAGERRRPFDLHFLGVRPLRRRFWFGLPGFQARSAWAGARDPRRGKGERHSDVRDLSWPGRYRDPGPPSG
jgi:NAD(P)-dependent dehydrogenase (short-subunit alcohol dehydrogenase family)